MAEYSHRFGSNFPNNYIEIGTKKDINEADASTVSIMNDLNEALANFDLSLANTIYQNNKEALSPYMDDAAFWNQIEEEIYNAEVMIVSKIHTIISDSEPVQNVNDMWYQPYD